MTEFSLKQARIQALLDENDIDALLLQRNSSFAWATCGAASYVNTAASNGAASLLLTRDNNYLITDNIEISRLQEEEKLGYQGWTFQVSPWYQRQDHIAQLVPGARLGADGSHPNALDLSAQIARLRARLTPEEGVRFRVLGRLCADAMDSTVRSVQPGQTEHQIAARLAFEARSRGVQAIVNLVATDERISQYRHPLPTYKTLENYAMLVMCGRRWGLICSLTRLVHFGALPVTLRQRAEATARVDAAMITATRPGITLGQIFDRAVKAYDENGFPGEWQHHHQGGATAYEPREYLGLPGSQDVVMIHQAYAWNPSIRGAKSEDTFQVGEHGNEILTEMPGWPNIEIEMDGITITRPAVMEIV